MLEKIAKGTLLLAAVWAMTLPSAEAAKLGRISASNAKFYESPDPDSRVVGMVPRGTPVATSDRAARGFYRAKAKGGLLGWLSEKDVAFGAKAASIQSKGDSRGSVMPKPFSVRVVGGMNTQAVNQSLAPTIADLQLPSGLGRTLGAEVGYRLNPRFSIVARVEQMSAGVVGNFDLNVTPVPADLEAKYDITVASMPIMAGGAFRLIGETNDKITGDLAGFVGYAMGTRITAVGRTSGGLSEYRGNGLTFMVKTNVDYHLTSSLFVAGELGYRILSRNIAQPTTVGAGAGLFDSNSDNSETVYESAEINLSGVVFSLGFGFRF